MAPHLSGKAGDVGRTGADNWLFINAVFWLARHGCAWRTLPERFGKYDTLRKRSRRWAQKGIWQPLFEAVQEPDLDWVMLDPTVVRAHAQAAGSRKKSCWQRSPRPQPRGLTTKIDVVVDALANPLCVVLGPGHQADGLLTYWRAPRGRATGWRIKPTIQTR
ncbi:IS5 family transposase [Hymenobacter sp. P5252]|uniref:IS5 family transposase n=1 Tax=Hymenobacter terrestris TaxID=2748310 RepID=A0ABX2Q1I0_9BACT|nr:IS5 family transposase [Hymenobacter terrestris]